MSTVALTPRQQQRMAWLASWLAAALALLALIRLLGLMLSGPAMPDAAAVSPQVESVPSESLPLAGWHLFGRPAALPTRVAAPETELRLFLRGTLSDGGASGGGIAIIADAEGHELAYRIGDALPGDAVLREIQSGRVILERNGRRETLSLPGARMPDESGPVAQTPARPLPNDPSKMPGASGKPFINPMISVGVPDLATARARALPDLRRMAQEVSILPVLEDGRMVGVRLDSAHGSELLSRYGIEPNDVITAVNGIPLDGPQRQLELTRSLSSAEQVRLTLRRDGRELQLNLGLR